MDAWIEAAASSQQPPAGAGGRTSLYGLLGGRLRLETPAAGALELSGRGGMGGLGERSSWGEGEAAWELARAGRRVAARLRAEAFGLDYARPFDYRAVGGSLQPRLSAAAGDAVISLRADLRRGSWSLGPATPGDSAATGVLALTGGALSAGGLIGPTWLEVGAEAFHGAFDGWFSGGTASAWTTRGALTLGVTTRAWNTPRGAELGLTAAAAVELARGASLRLEAGRTTTDPLYGTPANFGASIGLSLRVARGSESVRASPVVELGDVAGTGRRTRFRLHRPQAHAAALAGDFTDWKPRPMTRQGEDWVLELTLPAGVHHFSFLVDGRLWLVPAEAPGVAEDEWGRKNATLVVQP